MSKHEHKFCARCGASIECKVGSITLCQCHTVVLDEEERHYIRNIFDDCLCISCLKEMKDEFHHLKLPE